MDAMTKPPRLDLCSMKVPEGASVFTAHTCDPGDNYVNPDLVRYLFGLKTDYLENELKLKGKNSYIDRAWNNNVLRRGIVSVRNGKINGFLVYSIIPQGFSELQSKKEYQGYSLARTKVCVKAGCAVADKLKIEVVCACSGEQRGVGRMLMRQVEHIARDRHGVKELCLQSLHTTIAKDVRSCTDFNTALSSTTKALDRMSMINSNVQFSLENYYRSMGYVPVQGVAGETAETGWTMVKKLD